MRKINLTKTLVTLLTATLLVSAPVTADASYSGTATKYVPEYTGEATKYDPIHPEYSDETIKYDALSDNSLFGIVNPSNVDINHIDVAPVKETSKSTKQSVDIRKVRFNKSCTKVTTQWKKFSGAKRYKVTVYVNGKKTVNKYTTKCTYSFKATPEDTITIKVEAYKKSHGKWKAISKTPKITYKDGVFTSTGTAQHY